MNHPRPQLELYRSFIWDCVLLVPAYAAEAEMQLLGEDAQVNAGKECTTHRSA